ncbi:MAG: hypothetical protein J6S18_03635 [Oscillospiraceae bacterium]|nr:hypothetical protein [Oscillospiraceae bacterium]
MAYIRAYQAMPIFDGMPVTFKSPASCTGVEGLKVYYPVGEGVAVATFALADAHGNNVGSIDLFAANVLVKVILDTEKGMAFVQNADTNAYLEGRFEELENELDGVKGAINNSPGGTSTPIVNDLTTGGTSAALSAEMGKKLKNELDGLTPATIGAVSKSGDTMTGNLTISKTGGVAILLDEKTNGNTCQYVIQSGGAAVLSATLGGLLRGISFRNSGDASLDFRYHDGNNSYPILHAGNSNRSKLVADDSLPENDGEIYWRYK